MIYLIDDKKDRQSNDYYWTTEKLKKYSHILVTVYKYDEIKNTQIRESIFSSGNVILFHESFFDNTINLHKKESVEIRSSLNKFAEEKNGWVVFFSGSKSSRILGERTAHLPVSVFYKNLEDFFDKYSNDSIDLKCLAFGGKNSEIEGNLLSLLKDANNHFDETPLFSNAKNLLAKTGSRISIPIIFEGAVEKVLSIDDANNKELTQVFFDNKIYEWLSNEEVDNIFIPLCFGPTLSDYNGLQLACHIRCSDIINRLKPIYIYGFVDFSYLLDNDYFNILKTKNVTLINYTREAFESVLKNVPNQLNKENLPFEIKKLNLELPKNYEDSHGISNEWAIYRWANSISAKDNEIQKVTENVNHTLFFKYLNTIFPASEIIKIREDKLAIKNKKNSKILYIDDEADRGWFEIFCNILNDINGITFDYLDEELISKTPSEIIDTSLKKIIEDDIDLVILDFRLHSNDFHVNKIEEITGLVLLKEIKKLNPGIQVIVFSATKKVWNFQAIQEAGADGFIVKESPENSIESNFTYVSIINFCKQINNCLQMTFLKEAHNYLNSIEKSIERVSNLGSEPGFLALVKLKFKNEMNIQRKIVYDCLKNSLDKGDDTFEKKQSYLNLSFISIYKNLELINDYYTNDSGTKIKSSNTLIQKYDSKLNSFVPIKNDYPSTLDKLFSILHFELLQDISVYFNDISLFNSHRVNIIHPKNLNKYYKSTEIDNIKFLKVIDRIVSKMK